MKFSMFYYSDGLFNDCNLFLYFHIDTATFDDKDMCKWIIVKKKT